MNSTSKNKVGRVFRYSTIKGARREFKGNWILSKYSIEC